MIQTPPQMRVLVAVAPVDFRKGIDGMAQLCRRVLAHDPFSGTMFVFRSRRGNSIKILVYDGRGFWLCHKRLSEGRFRWWPGTAGATSAILEAHQLAVLLHGGDPSDIPVAPIWRPVLHPPI